VASVYQTLGLQEEEELIDPEGAHEAKKDIAEQRQRALQPALS
jgi:hypothetical protein